MEPPAKKPRVSLLFHNHDARKLSEVVKDKVHLVVTSPPYPMVSMWDECFRGMNSDIPRVDEWEDAMRVFELMHAELDKVWEQLHIVVCDGGIVAINIGDATRSVRKKFQLFPNASRATMGMMRAGFTPLPSILWKKPTNKPNAFLGSGFYPVNAYVTVDCEHILLFRKGKLRKFPPHDPVREASKFTMVERNTWFTQVWEGIIGKPQKTVGDRRSGAFPAEIPERLIRMFSVQHDTILDPFVGTGTTVHVAHKLGRRGVGLDISDTYVQHAKSYSNF